MSTIYVEQVTDAMRVLHDLPDAAQLAVTQYDDFGVDVLCTDLDTRLPWVSCTMSDVVRTVNGAARAWAEATPGAAYGGWLPADPLAAVAYPPGGGSEGFHLGGAA